MESAATTGCVDVLWLQRIFKTYEVPGVEFAYLGSSSEYKKLS